MGRLAACLVLVVACAPPPPETTYDDDTGLTGVRIAEGSLAGTWALATETATIVTVAVVGERNGGSYGLRLITRTWDAASRVYKESFRWCYDDIFAVEGTKSVVTNEMLESLSPTEYESEVDHAKGRFLTRSVVDMWGVRNLPDPMTTELPTKDNYTMPPQSDWMWDEDGDEKAGVTANLTGNLTSEIQLCSRSIFKLDGTIISPNRIQGLFRGEKVDQHVVEASLTFARGESNVRPHPNPRASWFDMVRLADGATCDDVRRLMTNGGIATTRPF